MYRKITKRFQCDRFSWAYQCNFLYFLINIEMKFHNVKDQFKGGLRSLPVSKWYTSLSDADFFSV